MSRVLHMIANGVEVGTLEQTHGGALRLFAPPVPGVPRLSLAFDPSEEPIPPRKALAYLEGILPDGDRIRQRLADGVGVSPRSPFKLISAIGQDCPGAVQFFTQEQLENPRPAELELVSDAEIAAQLREFQADRPDPAVMRGGRFSLAGAQDKLALRLQDGQWCEAQGMEPTTHIIKPGILGTESQALMEHVTLRTLGLLGLDVAHSEYTRFEDQPAIVVTRYDRTTSEEDGSVRRAHQEDFCQATSKLPSEKYDVTAAHVIQVLQTHGAPAGDVAMFVQAVLANWILGASDAHGKNYAVLIEADGITLAPLYDVSTQFGLGGEWERTVAMGIGGAQEFARIARRHVEKFAAEFDMDTDVIIENAVNLALLMPRAFAAACQELAVALLPHEQQMLERAHGELREHCRAVLRRLGA